MNLVDVIETLVEDRGLSRERVVEIVCESIQAAYQKKYPELVFSVVFNNKTGEADVFVKKEAVSSVSDDNTEISLRKAKQISQKAAEGDTIEVPFEGSVGRIEVLAAKQVISARIRELEQETVYEEYKDKQGAIISGMIHKKERGGLAVKVGDVMALLPESGCIPGEAIRIGYPVKVLLKEVLPVAKRDYQLILDRCSAEFVQRLIEQEIPEVFEGIVEVKKIVRVAGYKTKVAVLSNSKEIDPVGTCVGVGGARIKPILRELGKEKVDLVEWSENIEALVKKGLKPAEIDAVELVEEGRAIVWLAQDQRSLAIGKMGQNIMLASRLAGVEIQLQDGVSSGADARGLDLFGGEEE